MRTRALFFSVSAVRKLSQTLTRLEISALDRFFYPMREISAAHACKASSPLCIQLSSGEGLEPPIPYSSMILWRSPHSA